MNTFQRRKKAKPAFAISSICTATYAIGIDNNCFSSIHPEKRRLNMIRFFQFVKISLHKIRDERKKNEQEPNAMNGEKIKRKRNGVACVHSVKIAQCKGENVNFDFSAMLLRLSFIPFCLM